MLSRRLPTTRIPSFRPLRPPSYRNSVPSPRPFTQKSQLLLVARRTPRPQLPYLSQPRIRSSPQTTRLLSSETKAYIREQAWLTTKWTAILWTFLGLGLVAWYGIQNEMQERENPTPDEWGWRVRQLLRDARWRMDERTVESRVGFVSWANVGSDFLSALKLLEDPSKEGKELMEVGAEGEEILIPGVGRAGFDITAKSWPWRAGYFEVLMGCAQAAEHLDGMVLDKTRKMVFPKEVVIGPSNPDPRPTPPYMHSAPREEDCAKPYQDPEVFYMRVLTGRGFTTKQRLEAASAYAHWLDFKGLQGSAEEVYKWAVDIAKSALPDPNSVVDSETAILKQGEAAKDVTSNLLRATTELAVHHARSGNVSAALPIFLSTLRARRTAPVSPFPPPAAVEDDSSNLWKLFAKIFKPPKFPPPPPSGDEPLVRGSEKPTCVDSELMLYIGEILFATSTSADEGLGWTRQAVTIADANLADSSTSQSDSDALSEKRKCKECLITGVANWEAMLQRLVDLKGPQVANRKGWFSWSSSKASEEAESLESQLRKVSALKQRIASEGMDEQIRRGRSSNPSGVWLG